MKGHVDAGSPGSPGNQSLKNKNPTKANSKPDAKVSTLLPICLLKKQRYVKIEGGWGAGGWGDLHAADGRVDGER